MDDTLMKYIQKIETNKINEEEVNQIVDRLLRTSLNRKKVKEIKKQFGNNTILNVNDVLSLIYYEQFTPKEYKKNDIIYIGYLNKPNQKVLKRDEFKNEYWRVMICLKTVSIVECFYGYKDIMPDKNLFSNNSIKNLIEETIDCKNIEELNKLLYNFLLRLGDPHLEMYGYEPNINLYRIPGLFNIISEDSLYYFDKSNGTCVQVKSINNVPVKEFIMSKSIKYRFYSKQMAIRLVQNQILFYSDSSIDLEIYGINKHIIINLTKVSNQNNKNNTINYKDTRIIDSILVLNFYKLKNYSHFKEALSKKPLRYKAILLMNFPYYFKDFSVFNNQNKEVIIKNKIKQPWLIYSTPKDKQFLPLRIKPNYDFPDVPLYVYTNYYLQSNFEYNLSILKILNSNLKLIGSPTAGAGGSVFNIKLYTGLYFRFTATPYLIEGGEQFMYKGIQPDIPINLYPIFCNGKSLENFLLEKINFLYQK